MIRMKRGFTIIELMVTLAVAAIVVGIAIPTFNDQILNNRSIALGEDFASAINFARTEAIKSRDRISICASKDGLTCSDNWQEGFMVFVDYAASDTSTTPEPDPPVGSTSSKTILRIWEKQDAQANIAMTRSGTSINFIRYTKRGILAVVNNDPNPIIINAKLKKCTADSARKITIGRSGIINVARTEC